LRALVNVLTLTATPIPRTLQMALSGIRDLSVIESPPQDRLAIRTYVTRAEDHVVRDAILREIRRGGQVFFVTTGSIRSTARQRHLRELVPEAAIVVGHGQMVERELEQVMDDFIHVRANVLVCSRSSSRGSTSRARTRSSSIAPTPSAWRSSTSCAPRRALERARLRVSLDSRRAPDRQGRAQRLQALQELDELGGGFVSRTRPRDPWRWHMLGKQQSGHITAVGFELYTQMMEDAVREVRGETVTAEVEPEIQLGIPAFIPRRTSRT